MKKKTIDKHQRPKLKVSEDCGQMKNRLHNNGKWGHPDKVDQSQSRKETIDFNIFSSANEMSRTEQ